MTIFSLNNIMVSFINVDANLIVSPSTAQSMAALSDPTPLGASLSTVRRQKLVIQDRNRHDCKTPSSLVTKSCTVMLQLPFTLWVLKVFNEPTPVPLGLYVPLFVGGQGGFPTEAP